MTSPKTSLTVVTRSAAATKRLAASLARALRAPRTVALQGELGAGKTTFAQGFITALDVDARDVKSPTYALAVTHRAHRTTVHHLDLYRLDDEDALVALGLAELLVDEEAIALVEWPDRAPRLLNDAVRVTLTHAGARARTVVIEARRDELAAIEDTLDRSRALRTAPRSPSTSTTKRARVDR